MAEVLKGKDARVHAERTVAGKPQAYWAQVISEGGQGERKTDPTPSVHVVRLASTKEHPKRRTDLDVAIKNMKLIEDATVAGTVFSNLAKDFDKFHPDDVKEVVRAAVTRKSRVLNKVVPLKEAVGFMTIFDEPERATLFNAFIDCYQIDATFALGLIKLVQSFSPELQGEYHHKMMDACMRLPAWNKDEIIELLDCIDQLPEADRLRIIKAVLSSNRLDDRVAKHAFEKIGRLPNGTIFEFCQRIFQKLNLDLAFVKDILPETEWEKFILSVLRDTAVQTVFSKAIAYSQEFPVRERTMFLDAALKCQSRNRKSELIGLFNSFDERDRTKRRSDKIADQISENSHYEDRAGIKMIIGNISIFRENKRVELLKKVFESRDCEEQDRELAFGMIERFSDKSKPGLYLAAAKNNQLSARVLERVDLFKSGEIIYAACYASNAAFEKMLDLIESMGPEKRLELVSGNLEIFARLVDVHTFSIKLVKLVTDCPKSEEREKILSNFARAAKSYILNYSESTLSLSAILGSFPDYFMQEILEAALGSRNFLWQLESIGLFVNIVPEKRTEKLVESAKKLIRSATEDADKVKFELCSAAFHSIKTFSPEEQELLLRIIIKSQKSQYIKLVSMAIEEYAKLPQTLQKEDAIAEVFNRVSHWLTESKDTTRMPMILLIPLFSEDKQADLIENTIRNSNYGDVVTAVIRLIPSLPSDYPTSYLWADAKQKILDKINDARGYGYDGMLFLKCAEVLPIEARKEVILAAINQNKLDVRLASEELIRTLPVNEQDELRQTLKTKVNEKLGGGSGVNALTFEQTYAQYADPAIRSQLVVIAILGSDRDSMRAAAKHLGEVRPDVQADMLVRALGSDMKEVADAAFLLIPNQPKEKMPAIIEAALKSGHPHIARAALAYAGELEPLKFLSVIAGNPSLFPDLLEHFASSAEEVRKEFLSRLRGEKKNDSGK